VTGAVDHGPVTDGNLSETSGKETAVHATRAYSSHLGRCAALWLGLAIAGCAVTTDDPVMPGDDHTATTSAELTTPAATPAVGEEASPQATVFECTTTGNWWGTRAACQANCAGGTCFVCGLACQN